MRRFAVTALWLGLAAVGLCTSWAETRGPRADVVAGATVQVETEIIVPPAQRLEVAPSLLTWPVPTANDLGSGYLDAPEMMVLTVHSNVPWELAIRARDLRARDGAAGRSARPGGQRDDPEAPGIQILWRAEGGSFARLGGDWAPVASGVTGVAGEQVRIQLRIPLTWSGVRPGSYEPRIEYRLSPLRS